MLSFDASGNLLNDGVHSYTYDAENRIMQVDGGATATYAYDGNGTRIMKTANGTTTVYAYGGGQLVDEYDNGAGVNSPTREYIYGLGQRVAEIDGGTTIYYHDDHLSPRLLTDASGNVLTQQGHYPFGEAWYQNGQGTKWMFTSYPRDNETNNDYANARYFLNRFGRFMSADPADIAAEDPTNPQSWNLYAYVLNSPINLLDPSGMECVWDDGSYDSNDDPDTGSPSQCADLGGTWVDHSYFADQGLPDWSPDAGGATAEMASDVAWANQHPMLNPSNNSDVCIPFDSLNWSQKAQVIAAEQYAQWTGMTVGFGVSLDAGAGIGPKSSKWNIGVGGSGSTMIIADAKGNVGFLNSDSVGISGTKMGSTGVFGAGAASGPSVLVSPFSINTIKGPSASASAAGGAVLGAGASVTSSGAVTLTFGVGAGAEGSVGAQGGTSQFIPICQ